MLSARESQKTFRALLTAMSEPGTVTEVGPDAVHRVVATLVDHEVTLVDLGETHNDSGAPNRDEQWAERWANADFVVIRGGSSHGLLLEVRRGSLVDPADGATAIYEVAEVGRGPLTLRVAGPGVGPVPKTFAVDGLDPDEVAAFAQTRSGYPRGVDVILLDRDGRCVCLPRSVAVEQVEDGNQAAQITRRSGN